MINSDATMVRNAGGRAFDAIRTLSVLQTIGNPGTIVVMHHTGKISFDDCPSLTPLIFPWPLPNRPICSDMELPDCGLTHYHDADIKKALFEIDPGSRELIEASKFGEITNG
jgi:carbonic anhydrase